MEPVIDVQHLQKTYDDTVAVADISFAVKRGEIFGIVGPNGAGKTTTVESLIGLRQPDQGQIRVLGLDPQTEREPLIRRIGIQLQEAELPQRMRVWEALDLFSTFYAQTVPWEPLLDQWGLADKRDTLFMNLSGGQKQRLFIALALLNDPEIVFLDELTTGLDPQARRKTWELVRAIREQGKTVVLVTHFMDEAEALCDRVAIVDNGRIVALNSPAQLIHGLDGEQRVVFAANGAFRPEPLQELTPVTRVEQVNGDVVVYGRGDDLATAVLTTLNRHNVPVRNLRTQQPDLEDVFIALTGHRIRE